MRFPGGHFRLSLSATLLIAALLVFYCSTGVTASASGEAEPTYFIYHGAPKSLALDPLQVAVRTRTSLRQANADSNALPEGLADHGFTSSDLIEKPATEWMILNAQNVLARLNQRTPSASSVLGSSASSVHALITSLLASGDPSIEFISPVFRDARGAPALLTSRVLIGFKPDFSLTRRAQILEAVAEGASQEAVEFPQPNDQRWQIKTKDGFALLARANALAQVPGVTYAEPDMMVTGHANLVPFDPGFIDSWGLRNTGQSGGLVGFDMKATAAWDSTLGIPSVIVLVLDNGVQQNHPDINQVPGRDFTSNASTNPTGGPVGTYDSHGTAVAGCISERINNSLGTAGIAPGAKVASARIATNVKADGSFFAQDSWFVNALNWGHSIGARVSNNSNGTDMPSSAIESAYNSTWATGMIHFAGAGNNSGALLDFPANIRAVNAVGAVNRFGQRSSFSQFGPGLKFMAPGEAILTTDRTGKTGYVSTDYVITSGTSFASPYAAGVAALIISKHPGITASQVENIMASTCRDMGPPGYDTGYGYGLLDASRAVTAPLPALLGNISTRASVQTGDDILIGGFVVTGAVPKKVVIRAIGPWLQRYGVTDPLLDPTLELHNSAQAIIASNDDWRSAAHASQIPVDLQPSDDRESAILTTLQPGSYTAVMRGKNDTTGIALVEAYDLDPEASAQLINVSSRALVQTGDSVMIGGFVLSGANGSTQVVVRALGPSLGPFGIVNPLADPTLELRNVNGTLVSSNDNWKSAQQTAIQATGRAPGNDLESAIVATLPAGSYTSIVAGKGGATGIGLVEVYNLH